MNLFGFAPLESKKCVLFSLVFSEFHSASLAVPAMLPLSTSIAGWRSQNGGFRTDRSSAGGSRENFVLAFRHRKTHDFHEQVQTRSASD